MELFYAQTFFLLSNYSAPFRLNYRKDNKFSSTEPKFDISIMNIAGKNSLLNSKNTFIHVYFARLFRPWVNSAQDVSAPSYFNLWIFLA